jgi:hypothetical protein
MNNRVYNEIVGQFKKLLKNRGYAVNRYTFKFVNNKQIDAYNNKVIQFTVNLDEFSLVEMYHGSARWSQYKTILLNKYRNTTANLNMGALNIGALNIGTLSSVDALASINALVAVTKCIDWQGVTKGDVGGIPGLSGDIDNYLANSALWDGITITAKLDGNQGRDSVGNLLKLMIFDTSNPSGEDPDLKTPINSASNTVGGIDKGKSHGNVLIVSEDNDTQDPDDKAFPNSKSKVTFNFSEPVHLQYLEFIDSDDPNDSNTSHNITMFGGENGTGSNFGRAFLGNIGDNGAQRLPLDVANVKSFVFEFVGSGAISDICFRKQNETCSARIVNANNEVDKCFVYPNNENYIGWTSNLVKSTSFDNTYNIYASPSGCSDFTNLVGNARLYVRGFNNGPGYLYVNIVITDPKYTLVDSNISITPSIVATDTTFGYTYGSGMGSFEFDVIGESTNKVHFYDIDYLSISDNFYLLINATLKNNSIGNSSL